MKNTFGNSVSITLFGESHGNSVGAVIDGLAPGIRIDEDFIRHQLSLRRPCGKISTARVEEDDFTFESGVFGGVTTGTPICIIIKNKNVKSEDYSELCLKPRPGHADYTAYMKYHGNEDPRGGGHFSGRITAALVAAGAIVISALQKKGIEIATHILRCGGISDRDFSDLGSDFKKLNSSVFAVLDDEKAVKMTEAIEQAAKQGDSVGGILQTCVTGIPAGVGEPWFDTVESLLAHSLFSVPGVKGVEFGSGFRFADMRGSEANDPFIMKGENIVTATNNNGGINGGITNGMPLLFNCCVKPTPSISLAQKTVDVKDKTETEITVNGRHDPCIVHRARVVVDSITALTLCDLLSLRYGTDWLSD